MNDHIHIYMTQADGVVRCIYCTPTSVVGPLPLPLKENFESWIMEQTLLVKEPGYDAKSIVGVSNLNSIPTPEIRDTKDTPIFESCWSQLAKALARRDELMSEARKSLAGSTTGDRHAVLDSHVCDSACSQLKPQSGWRVDPRIVQYVTAIVAEQMTIEQCVAQLKTFDPSVVPYEGWQLDPLISGLLNVVRTMRPVVEAAIELQNARRTDQINGDPELAQQKSPRVVVERCG